MDTSTTPAQAALGHAAAALPTKPRRDVSLEVAWARHADEVRDAQRLRWRVFADEMGARLAPPPGTPEGLDVDRFAKSVDRPAPAWA